MLGFILPGLGRIDEAARALDDVIRQCEERSDSMHLGAALSNRALVRSYRGDRAGMIPISSAPSRWAGSSASLCSSSSVISTSPRPSYLMDDLEAAAPHAQASAALASRCGESYRTAVLALEARLRLYAGDEACARAVASELRALTGACAPPAALSPSEDVLCTMVELAIKDADELAWDDFEARSSKCSVGQEQIEVLETRGLAALRHGRRAEARRQLGKALNASSRIPNAMRGRLRRWIAEAEQYRE